MPWGERQKRWHAKPENKARRKAYHRELADRKRAIVNEAKSAPCARCGEAYPPYVMDLHHTDPVAKLHNLAAIGSRYSEGVVRAEIAKCIALCANCHRITEHETEEGTCAASVA